MFESFSWEHGVMVGACVKSESTAAAEHTGIFLLSLYRSTCFNLEKIGIIE